MNSSTNEIPPALLLLPPKRGAVSSNNSVATGRGPVLTSGTTPVLTNPSQVSAFERAAEETIAASKRAGASPRQIFRLHLQFYVAIGRWQRVAELSRILLRDRRDPMESQFLKVAQQHLGLKAGRAEALETNMLFDFPQKMARR